jgi:hypothetical protein
MHFLSSDTDKYKGVFIVALKISGFSIFGGDEWARTTDPLHVKQIL